MFVDKLVLNDILKAVPHCGCPRIGLCLTKDQSTDVQP